MNIIEETKRNLEKNNMKVYTVESKDEVYPLIKSLIKKEDVIGFGGSMTLEETKVLDSLINDGYNVLDRRKSGLTPEEIREIYRKCFFADWFLMSSNAITKNGLLYNVDGNGNRVAALIYGPDRVIVVAGKNKIVENENEAVLRVKKIACPRNCERLDVKSYCLARGHCMSLDTGGKGLFDGCNSDTRICCNYVVSSKQKVKDRIVVILVNEELGY